MLENLTERLSRVVKTLRGQARLTDDNIQEALREVRLALLEADVALPVVKDFVARVREQALGEEVVGSLTPGQALVGVVHRELTALMGGAAEPLDLATQPPAVFLLAGLQGAGKTTTAAKLARLLREEQKKKVLLVSADVYRPAAIDQLRLLAAQVGVDFFPSTPDQKPVDIAEAALDWARRHYHDVLIVDTAGPARDRRGDDGGDPRVARRGAPDRDAVRRRRDAGPGRGQHRARRSARRCRSPASC